jgi:hypothetical protein
MYTCQNNNTDIVRELKDQLQENFRTIRFKSSEMDVLKQGFGYKLSSGS